MLVPVSSCIRLRQVISGFVWLGQVSSAFSRLFQFRSGSVLFLVCSRCYRLGYVRSGYFTLAKVISCCQARSGNVILFHVWSGYVRLYQVI